MSRFNKHFKMNEEDVIEYCKEKINYFSPEADLTCVEFGDGNINYIFRVEDKKTNKSVIVKHADTSSRLTGGAISTDRSLIENEVLALEKKLTGDLVPEVYFYDPIMACTIMEDLKDYGNLRHELCKHKIFKTFAEDVSTFLAKTLILTMDCIIDPKEKKELVKRYINPELCEVSERLVYTEPYLNERNSNRPLESNMDFYNEKLYGDKELKFEAAKLKETFKWKAQSLIHGDLHTGSLMAKEDKVMTLDPEFAFYGPAGYDIGNIVANMMFAYVNGYVTMEDGKEKDEYLLWITESITETIDLFKEKAYNLLKENITDSLSKSEEYINYLIDDILADTAGVAGAEGNRRIIGAAKVKDIAGISDIEKRKYAERICILSAIDFIKNRNIKYKNGSDYVETIKKNCELAMIGL